MATLTAEKCVACRVGAPTMTADEIAEFQPQIPEWKLVEPARHTAIGTGLQSFGTLPKALAFTNAVGDLAEEEGHHPALLTEWGRVTVTWWTHKIKGLHRNDFIMAAKTDALYQG